MLAEAGRDQWATSQPVATQAFDADRLFVAVACHNARRD